MPKDALKEIVFKKEQRIKEAKLLLPEEELKAKIASLEKPRDFMPAINRPRQISLIAEIKKASPSQGVIRKDFSHLEIARAYEQAQVQAISVLTEEDFFLGSLSFLREVKGVTTLPLLRKDFILEPYQVYESRLYGADAILLIAELLTKDKINQMLEIASGLGMSCLVEVHSEKELKKVLAMKVPLLGINNRNLHTLEVDFKTTERLYPLIPKAQAVVVESAVRSRQDVLFLKILGVNAVLIGQAFMEAPDIRRKVEEVMGW